LAQDWSARYFSECQTAIEHDLPAAINKDLKRMDAQLPLHG
jgi:inorganic pyrophosphatase